MCSPEPPLRLPSGRRYTLAVTCSPALRPTRWGISATRALTPDPAHSDDRAWSDRGGYVSGFDEAFQSELAHDPFTASAESLLALDPLFHWVLRCGREALREAGHEGSHDRVSAVLGNLSFPSSRMAAFAEHVWLDRPAVDPRNRFMSGLPALLLAEQLGLGGGAFALDAACASSLYAIKLACDQLHDRQVDLALAGAVCRSDDLFIHVGFCALDAMSRTGRSRPFHAGADGLVPAEGCAVVALKRLTDAVTAGDRIFGVIRGVGLSNDGRGRGLLAPDAGGQARALRNAWAHAGVDPARLSLVECHATGTPVGDATELATLKAVFGNHAGDAAGGLALGSLKSNLGHLITTAGAAAVLKVLGAFEAGVRPPTLHVDEPNPAVADTPYRLLTEAEPWSSYGPRVAGINAFGFGGNNAHLILEEYVADAVPKSPQAAPRPPVDIAVVGLGVRAPNVAGAAELAAALEDGRPRITPGSPARGRIDEVTLPLQGLKFPPRDLEQTLAQQLLVLAAAMEACDGAQLPTDRTAVIVGSQADPEVCRYGARWRIAEWHADRGAEWVAAARDAVIPVLRSAGVVGNMPNIPANRIGSQLDLGGPGFTVAAEQHSGLEALHLAVRMLAAGEVDVALAGAVDVSAEPVHEAAHTAVIGPTTAGDAAVVLRLKRLDDARRDGDPVLAVVGGETPTLALGADGIDLAPQFGTAHAAHCMLHVAAAVVSCATARRPGSGGPATPWDGPRIAEITSRGHAGSQRTVRLKATADTPVTFRPAPEPPRPLTFVAHPPEIRMPSHPDDPARDREAMAPAPALPSALVDPPAAVPGPTGFEADPVSTLPLPPPLPRLTATPVPDPPPRPAPVPAQAAIGSPRPAAAPVSAPTATPTAATGIATPHLAELAALHRQLSDAHRAYLARQQAVHAQFLDVRQRTQQALIDAFQRRGQARPSPLPSPPPPVAAPSPVAPTAAPVSEAPPRAEPPPAPPPVVPTPEPPAPATPGPGPAAAQLPRLASDLPGPKYSREDLEILASSKISRIFGPMFEVQDDFPRQVRMPEPPLLLADRVTGIDAEPGSMTTGVIWTETDVVEGAWYLHEGTMPAGAMIEAGQADLLLISYLGADFRNRGERVYRLLGCQLTYSGGLPRPGETLHYEIHIDGHANVGDTAIFFFHYDCVDQDGHPRLTVREGQAGFFTDEELADSGGILWTPETGEYAASARVDQPKVDAIPGSYSTEQVMAFAHGDSYACFGEGYTRLQTHVRTPRATSPQVTFWQRVTHLDPQGGPWGRGYFRAEQDLRPDDWFFQGHFKDDPCMPGTMMFEACLQASSFYLTALGYTLDKDGWTFEPVPELTYDLKCRGQVIPSSKLLIYEVFIEEVHDGPWPTVYADFLCTVDGLKAFWARRVGVRLRPDWPITTRPELLADYVEPEPVAVVQTESGPFAFGYASLLACAWGKPSDAFGPMYGKFDDGMPCPRLPGPPYHFMSRVTRIDGPIGGMKIGTEIELSYDIPPDAWYFDENGFRTMPFCVLLEAALQPCGWIASYVGSVIPSPTPLFFRNLDGTATWKAECVPNSGTLRTVAKITSISQSGGMIIEGFEVSCFLGDTEIYEMTTVFGFFPRAALANQTGIVPSDEERAALAAPSDFAVDLTTRPERYCGGKLRLPTPMLLMLDRVTGYWPEGGKAGLGRARSEKDVDPSEWFFKAHFFSDPVQPGSLGLEAMLQLMQFVMIERDMHAGMVAPRFEPLMIDQPITWKYRGQVVPENQVIRCEIEVTEVGDDERGRYLMADAYLWVDALRIYQGVGVGMRIVDDGPATGSEAPVQEAEETLDPTGWLADHCPTYTLPALPAMSMVDRLAARAKQVGSVEVVEVRDVSVLGWVKAPGRIRTELESSSRNKHRVILEAWRERPDARLSRFEAAAQGTVVTASSFPRAPQPWSAPRDVTAWPDPYASGALFHGEAFRYLTSLAVSASGSVATFDAANGTVPVGALGQGLLDAVLHAIPHADLHRWDLTIDKDLAAYPHHIESLRLFGPPPVGEFTVIAKYGGRVKSVGGAQLPRIQLQAFDVGAGRVWCELDIIEVLLPKGPIGRAPGPARVAFLARREPVPGLGLSDHEGEETQVTAEAVRASDWLPGTVAEVYRSPATSLAELAADVAVGDHVAWHAGVHPGTCAARRGRGDEHGAAVDPLPGDGGGQSRGGGGAGSERSRVQPGPGDRVLGSLLSVGPVAGRGRVLQPHPAVRASRASGGPRRPRGGAGAQPAVPRQPPGRRRVSVVQHCGEWPERRKHGDVGQG